MALASLLAALAHHASPQVAELAALNLEARSEGPPMKKIARLLSSIPSGTYESAIGKLREPGGLWGLRRQTDEMRNNSPFRHLP